MPHRAPMVLGACLLFSLAALGSGDPQVSLSIRKQAPPARTDFRSESDLVLVPVSVTDARNHAVTGLSRAAFHVFDEKTEQTIVQFSSEDLPISVGIVFDLSGSMTGKLAKSREAIDKFLRFANPEDEFFLVEFSDRPRLTVPFTSDTGRIQDRLRVAQPKGTTALLDAVCLAMNGMRQARYSRRALLVLSDGGDNHSRYSASEIRSRIRESALWIYSMGIFEQRPPVAPEVAEGRKLLQSLADESGGRNFSVDSLIDLPVVAARISLELRNQYVLGYRPVNPPRDGKYHRVEVNVVDPRDLRVFWRPGYYGMAE